MIRELFPGTYVRTSHIQKLQSVVVVDQGAIYVVDPCYFPDEIDEIRHYARQFESANREKYLILTHSDFDHIAGVHEFPDYTVIASSAWDEANELRSIDTIESFDSEFYVDRAWSGKMPRVRIHHKFKHGETFGKFTFYHAQGHTWDGLVSIYDSTAIVGDYLSAVEFPFVYTSYQSYLNTLSMFQEVFERHSVDTVITQHGPAALDKAEIQRRIHLSEDYLNRAVELVNQGIERGFSIDEIIQSASDFKYEGQPIAIGIRNFHTRNLKLIHQERLGS